MKQVLARKSDYHVHSKWSPDSSMETLSILEICRENKILDVAFTDHVDLFYPKKTNLGFDIPAYQKEIFKLRKYYHDITILVGIEVGANQTNLRETENFLQKHSFDFVIASIHTSKEFSFCNRLLTKKLTIESLLDIYFQEMIFVTKNLTSFQVLGHIDYLLRYHSISCHDFLAHQEQIETVLTNIIKKNHGLEINTKSWSNDKLNEPMQTILSIYKKLGGQYLTIGSDSHSLNQLGKNFDKAILMINKAGFTHYHLFRNKEWVPVPIAEYLEE